MLAFGWLHLTDAAFASQRTAAEDECVRPRTFVLCRFTEKRGINPELSLLLLYPRHFRVARHPGAIERGLARTGGEEFTSTSTRGSVQNRRASSTLTNGASRLLASRGGIKSRSVLTYASAKTMFAS